MTLRLAEHESVGVNEAACSDSRNVMAQLAPLARSDNLEEVQDAATILAGSLASDEVIRSLDGVETASCLDSLCKWRGEIFQRVAVKLATQIERNEALRTGLPGKSLIECLAALGKWSKVDICTKAAMTLARQLLV